MPAELDIEREPELLRYLQEERHIAPDERPAIAVLAGGVSCRTVRVDRPTGESWVIKQALPKLRVEADWFSDPERIHREAMAMEMLGGLVPPGSMPGLIFEDAARHLVAMEAVPEPHDVWKQLLLAGRVEDDHVRQFAELLATIHRESLARSVEFSAAFADRSFFETLRLEPYYEYSATREPAAAGFLHDLIEDTRRNPLTLTHGDFSPKNVLVHDGRLVLLDHEVMHWGDGAFDLGFGMTHLLAKSRHVAGRRDAFRRAVLLFWETYRASALEPFTASTYEQRVVRHTIGCVLARAVGKSPLEYLSSTERDVQTAAALELVARPPATVAALVAEFTHAADEVAR